MKRLILFKYIQTRSSRWRGRGWWRPKGPKIQITWSIFVILSDSGFDWYHIEERFFVGTKSVHSWDICVVLGLLTWSKSYLMVMLWLEARFLLQEGALWLYKDVIIFICMNPLHSQLQLHAFIFHRKMDRDRDGKIGWEDFTDTVAKQPLMMEAFGECLPYNTGKYSQMNKK